MSVTFSEVAAAALREVAGQAGMADRRLVLPALFGLRSGELFAALEPALGLELSVDTGTHSHRIRGIPVGEDGRVLMPYLVEEARPSTNSGSAGFAATLRTQFLERAAEERVLLVLDSRPVETVRSATEDARQLPELGWEPLVLRALRMAAERAGVAAYRFPERVVRAFIRHREPDQAAFADFLSWVDLALGASDEVGGREVWRLGCFLADPEAASDAGRLEEGAKLRAQLDERYASRSKSWEAEVRKLLQRKGVPAEVIDTVVAAAGPFGVRYERFTLGDLLRREAAPPPLRTDGYDPVAGVRAALREGDALVAWTGAASPSLELRLSRAARSGDQGSVAWSVGDRSELELISGNDAATLPLPESDSEWMFGVLELLSASISGGAEVTEQLQLAVHRSDRGWFATEDALAVDAASAAFICEHDPVAIAYGEGAEVLGRCSYSLPPGAEGEAERHELEVGFRGGSMELPVLLLGDTTPDDPGPPEEPPDNGPEPPGDPPPGPDRQLSEHPSVPHSLLAADRAEWPEAELRDQPDARFPQVEFRIGARSMRVAAQRPAGIDGAETERAILRHPEWTSYVWSESNCNLSRAPGAVLAAGDLPTSAVERFTTARAMFFVAAAARGSVYATDPRGAEASAYIEAYAELLGAVPAEGRYVADWDALLLCDSVFLAGRQDMLLAPTSPLAVAFHAGLAGQLAAWREAADVPPDEDVRALSLRHAVPLLNARGQWYETSPVRELLWRHYVPLKSDAPGVPERNASYIAQRLHFFLRVHSAYHRPDQVLSVAFHEPGDGRTVFDALRAFYWRERKAAKYTLPRLHVWLVGGDTQLGAEVADLLGGGRQDDLDRIVQSRVTVTARPLGQPPDFAHVTFLFRSPGFRAPRDVPMTDRPPTAHLDGLAAAPGRKVYEERNQVFAWGTWAPADTCSGTYGSLLSRSLELVAGQPTSRLAPGWTQMASTSVDQEALDELYRERSVWVVHLDRLIGIEAFGGARQLIEYEERADPDQPGYDGITATEQVEPYLDAVARALRDFGEPGEDALRRILQLLNAVSGRWAIELLQRGDNDILQRIGFVAAIAAIEQLEGCLGTAGSGTGVLVALDELIAGRPHAGLPRFSLPVPMPEGRMCDDLLLLWLPQPVPDGHPVTVRGAVIEVKYAGRGRAGTDEARGELARTRAWLHQAFNAEGSSRPFRARDLAELIAAAGARAGTFQLGDPVRREALDPALARIVAGDYELDLTHWRDGRAAAGIVVSVEAESGVATHQSGLDPPGEPADLLRLGRPLLRQLVAGARVRGAGRWEPLSFEPPATPDGPDGEPQPSSPPTPGSEAHEAPASDATGTEGVEGPEAGRAGSTAVAGPTPHRPGTRTPDQEREVAEFARALDAAMEKYRLAAEPFQPELAQVGPNVVRFRTRALGPLSVADVERRARDLAREIGAPSAVIVSQEPRYLCIDVPRTEREPVYYRDVAAMGAGATPGGLPFIAGVAPSGDVRVADLARLPHLLVAGATGSGKSVFLRAVLCHLVRTHGPAALRLLVVDPKQLDFAGFAALPHLEQGRIISDPAEAVEILQQTIETELERRRPILTEAGATSATEFYEQGGSHEDLSQMVVLVDEFADLAGVLEGKDRRGFHELIQRYAQLTRAFGIYLVLATQRPSVDVITGSIKANLTARVALSLPSHRDSMTVLDRPGAEDLLGNGDLLFYVNGRVERLQGAFADASDVSTAVERWRGVPNPGAGQ